MAKCTATVMFPFSQPVPPFSALSGICCLAPKPLSPSPAQGKASGAAWISDAQGPVHGDVLWAVFSVVKEETYTGCDLEISEGRFAFSPA